MRSLLVNEDVTRAFLEALVGRSESKSNSSPYYFHILSREKYGGVNQIFFRKVCRADKLIEEIHKATPLRGFYDDKGRLVPHDSLGVYISAEPRDLEKAGKAVCAAFILKPSNSANELDAFNMPSLFLSECQKNPAQRLVLDVDIDVKDKYDAVKQALGEGGGIVPEFTLETRGGYHLLYYELTKVKAKLAYDTSQSVGDVDLLKNSLIPLPGTLQGGFEVKWTRGYY